MRSTRQQSSWLAMHMHMIKMQHQNSANNFSTYAALNPNNRKCFQRDEISIWKQKQEKLQHWNAKCRSALSWLSRQNLVVVMGSRLKEKFTRWMDQPSMTSQSFRSCDSLSRNSWRQKDLKIRCLPTQDRKHGMNQKIPFRQKQIIYS